MYALTSIGTNHQDRQQRKDGPGEMHVATHSTQSSLAGCRLLSNPKKLHLQGNVVEVVNGNKRRVHGFPLSFICAVVNWHTPFESLGFSTQLSNRCLYNDNPKPLFGTTDTSPLQ